MNALTAVFSVFVLGSTVFYAQVSDACTDPSEEAGDPSVEPGDPTGAIPPGGGAEGEDPSGSGDGEGGDPGGSSGDPDPAGEGDGDGDGETAGGGGDPSGGEGGTPDPGGEGTPDPGSEDVPTFTPDPSSESDGVGSTPSFLVAVEWQPGYDVDADPERGYFRHDGHKIETRVVIFNRVTNAVVLEQRVPQYNYESATRNDPGPTVARFATRLPPGKYLAKVQSVFYKHDEIRYGMDGRWIDLEDALPAPAIDDAVRGVAFNVAAIERSTDNSPLVGGCAATGAGDLASGFALLALLGLGLVRRRRAA